MDGVCLLQDAEVSCSLVLEWKRSGEGPWERNLGAVSDGSRQARGAKKFTHPESRSRKPVWPELQGGGSRKMELGKSPDGVCALQ